MTTLTPSTRTPSKRSLRLRIAGVCAAGALLLAGGGYALTGAVFTDEETVTGNTVGAASLTIGETAAIPVDVRDLLPGMDETSPTVLTFTNTGTVPFRYTVRLDKVTAAEGAPAQFLGWIPVTISNGTVSETGTLAAPPILDAPATAVGATTTISVTVGLDENADNTAQGKSASFDLVVTATQL